MQTRSPNAHLSMATTDESADRTICNKEWEQVAAAQRRCDGALASVQHRLHTWAVCRRRATTTAAERITSA
jgi:hypothetical protein